MTANDRIAGAPISWGVCEVPGWGHQLSPQRVLTEMHDLGLAATELGPDGFLPADPDRMAAVLDSHHLRAVGGFTPVLLHVPGHDPVPSSSAAPTRPTSPARYPTESPTPISKTSTPPSP
jgi:inosose dehydratase